MVRADGEGKCRLALVVEDSAALSSTLKELLSEYALQVQTAGSVSEARELIEAEEPQLVLLDYELPDGTAEDILSVIEACDLCPAVVVITGKAQSDQSFELARRGVQAFVKKPCSRQNLKDAISRAQDFVPDPARHVRANVGKRSIDEVEETVRAVMVLEAIKKSGGSVRSAASILGISRQRLQHILKALPRSSET